MTLRSALVAGATGLVGSALVRRLAADGGWAVRALVRRPVRLPTGVEPVQVDFDRLDARADALAADAVFCALGTTMRAAGSRAAFRRVDHDYPLALARLARQRGARHFLLVSALGASPRSPAFYNRVKAEVEEDIRALAFPGVTIVRPSLLLGSRAEFRLGERVAAVFTPIIPRAWKPIHADAVAAALVRAASAPPTGTRILENRELHAQAPDR